MQDIKNLSRKTINKEAPQFLRINKLSGILAENTMKKYNIIYADPPWAYQDKNCRGASARHYKTMTNSELQSLPIKDIAADDCILFM